MQEWFQLHDVSIKTLSPFQYSLHYPHLNMTKLEKNRMIQADIINLENIRAWISPTTFVGMKIAYHKALYSHSSEDEFIISLTWIHIYLMRSVVG